MARTKKPEQTGAQCPSCGSDNVKFRAGGAITCGACGKSLEPVTDSDTDGQLAERQTPQTSTTTSRGPALEGHAEPVEA